VSVFRLQCRRAAKRDLQDFGRTKTGEGVAAIASILHTATGITVTSSPSHSVEVIKVASIVDAWRVLPFALPFQQKKSPRAAL
jgi:hypothetical protein